MSCSIFKRIKNCFKRTFREGDPSRCSFNKLGKYIKPNKPNILQPIDSNFDTIYIRMDDISGNETRSNIIYFKGTFNNDIGLVFRSSIEGEEAKEVNRFIFEGKKKTYGEVFDLILDILYRRGIKIKMFLANPQFHWIKEDDILLCFSGEGCLKIEFKRVKSMFGEEQ